MEHDNLVVGENVKSLFVTLIMFLVCETASSAVLWAGGEDVDFPNGGSSCVFTGASNFRSSHAREAVSPCAIGGSFSSVFSGGAITSGWISGRVYYGTLGTSGHRFFGFGKSGTNYSLWTGTDSNTNYTKLALYKYDGTTWTKLASEVGVSLTYTALNRIDMQVTNYGASATVNIYVNGGSSAALSYSGDVTVGGNTNLDRVAIYCNSGTSCSGIPTYGVYSELIVASSDTRNMSLATLAPNAAGDLNQWTGSYTDLNETTISDATVVANGVSGNNFQCNLSNLPTGSYSIQAVKISSRATKSETGPTSIAVGVKTNSTVSVPAATSLPVAFQLVETLYSTNPVTSSAWTSTEIDALQINLQIAP